MAWCAWPGAPRVASWDASCSTPPPRSTAGSRMRTTPWPGCSPSRAANTRMTGSSPRASRSWSRGPPRTSGCSRSPTSWPTPRSGASSTATAPPSSSPPVNCPSRRERTSASCPGPWRTSWRRSGQRLGTGTSGWSAAGTSPGSSSTPAPWTRSRCPWRRWPSPREHRCSRAAWDPTGCGWSRRRPWASSPGSSTACGRRDRAGTEGAAARRGRR